MLGCRSVDKTGGEIKNDISLRDSERQRAEADDDSLALGCAARACEVDNDDDDDDDTCEYVKDTETNIVVHRVEWRRGTTDNMRVHHRNLQRSSAWQALATIPEEREEDLVSSEESCLPSCNGKAFECSWDHMFSENAMKEKLGAVDDTAMDQLLGLLSSASQAHGTCDLEPVTEGGIALTMLSQGRQNVAMEIQEKISSNPQKLAALQMACPSWKENISFALFQEDESAVLDALTNISNARRRMEQTKQKIMEAWERQQIALEVFETALNGSLNRLRKSGGEVCETLPEGGFLTALSPTDNQVDEENEFSGTVDGHLNHGVDCTSPKCATEEAGIHNSPYSDQGYVLSY